MRFLLLFFAVSTPCLAYDYEVKPDAYAGKTEFNGYHLSDFKGFTSWKLVTVRYRKDTGEMRFVYANPAAEEALRNGGKTYPDGAIFAKIGIHSEEDAAFPSSVTPVGAKRFQFMVRNKEKYKDTDGWGYVLFDEGGKTFTGEPHLATIACNACHKIVADRGLVFSKIANLSDSATFTNAAKAAEEKLRVPFEETASSKLPTEVRALLPGKVKLVSRVSGALEENLFLGTLDEIRPALIQEAAAKKRPALLLSLDKKRFSLVLAPAKSKTCSSGSSVMSYTKADPLANRIETHEYCQ